MEFKETEEFKYFLNQIVNYHFKQKIENFEVEFSNDVLADTIQIVEKISCIPSDWFYSSKGDLNLVWFFSNSDLNLKISQKRDFSLTSDSEVLFEYKFDNFENFYLEFSKIEKEIIKFSSKTEGINLDFSNPNFVGKSKN